MIPVLRATALQSSRRSGARLIVGTQLRLRRYATDQPPKSEVPVPRETSRSTEIKKVEYVPPATYQRVSYEYPAAPKPERIKPKESSSWKKHIPFLSGVGLLIWCAYTANHLLGQDADAENHILTPEEFSTFKVTFKEDFGSNMQLIELSPKYEQYRELLKKKGTLWNGKKIWSIEVKQPQIQVVRRYTPLPLYYMQYRENGETKALLKMLGTDDDEGKMVLLVKKYNDGEVSRYLHDLPVGSELQIRGPYYGYRFPYTPLDKTLPRAPMEDVPSRMLPEFGLPEELPKPENIAFFAGGTGISAILQPLLSRNPPRGNVDVFYSVRDSSEIPFSRFLLFLEKAGRAKFHYYVDNEGTFLTANDIKEPAPMNYQPKRLTPKTKEELQHELEVQEMMEKLIAEKAKTRPTVEETKGAPKDAPKDEPKDASETPRTLYKSVLDQVALNKSKYYNLPYSIAVVCGPQGYINYVAGDGGLNNDRPISGLLGEKGWTNENTYRMEA